MPRKARQESKTDFYHVLIRGANREGIFELGSNKGRFLEYLEEERESLQIYAWNILDNHVHMVVRTSLEDMAKSIKVVCLKYAAYYNGLYHRSGSVFGNRYKSEIIEEGASFIQAIRYIHNHPIVNGANDCRSYLWSSYTDIITGTYNRAKREMVLSFFDNDIEVFKAYHLQGNTVEFVDIREDLLVLRLEKAQGVIEDFIQRKEIEEISSFFENPHWVGQVADELLHKTNLTVRQINQLTGVSVSRLYRIKNNM